MLLPRHRDQYSSQQALQLWSVEMPRWEKFTVLSFAFGRAPELPSPHYPHTLDTMGYVECPFLECGYMYIFGALTVLVDKFLETKQILV